MANSFEPFKTGKYFLNFQPSPNPGEWKWHLVDKAAGLAMVWKEGTFDTTYHIETNVIFDKSKPITEFTKGMIDWMVKKHRYLLND